MIKKVLSLVLALSIVVSVFCSSTAFADDSVADGATVSGYPGIFRFEFDRDLDMREKGETINFWVDLWEIPKGDGTNADRINVNTSNVKVDWSISDNTAATITDIGYDSKNNEHKATLKVLKSGVKFYVYATVNGTKLGNYVEVLEDPVPLEAIYFDKNNINLNGKGSTDSIVVTHSPGGKRLSLDHRSDDPVSSSNPNVAVGTLTYDIATNEDRLTITAVANGTANITVTECSAGKVITQSCIVTVKGAGAAKPLATVKSDTTNSISLKKGSSYTVKLTTANMTTAPALTIGTDSILKVRHYAKYGNNYYYKITAVGDVGTGTGIYVNLAGQASKLLFNVSVK